MTRLVLRYLTSEDLGFADSLRAGAGWNQTLTDWQRFLELSPTGCLLAECEGRPVATATTICYGRELAWIGMILVHPDFRHRGIARVLLRHCIEILNAAGIKSIKLDATPAGREVYLPLGFNEEFNLTRYAVENAEASSPAPAIRPIRETDLPQILALDEAAIGAPRENLLRRLLAQSSRALVFESSPNHITGFGLLRPGSLASYLGPIIATDPTHGEALASALASGKTFCDLPDHNQSGVAWAESRNFIAQRTLTRMYLGHNTLPTSPANYFAIAAPDLG